MVTIFGLPICKEVTVPCQLITPLRLKALPANEVTKC